MPQLPGLKLAIVHGRMPAAKREETMAQFKAGKIHVLVATTVIEVGVDVPNATLMVIENAERMGLAQLHQLRGRVGRGSQASACVLLYRMPLSPMARARLQAIRETNAQLRVADLVRDADLLPQVQRAADAMLTRYEERITPLAARWIGTAEQYGRVG